MSALSTKKTNEESIVKKLILPAYIVLSALFILYIAYSYMQSVVYQSWADRGMQQGYSSAVVELINRVGEKCEPVAITASDTQVDVINVACLQAPQAQNQTVSEAE